MGQRDPEWWQRQLSVRLGVPFATGNRVDVLRNGDEIFPAMLDAIAAARRRVELVSFVWWTGDIVERFASALTGRARAGIEVHVVLDEFGASDADDRTLDQMRDAGVDLRLFRPRARWKVWESNHRCHRRVLVCDGQVGFTGGVGIAQEWTGDARGPGEWRDTHLRIEGPAVAQLRGAFFDTWAEVADDLDGEVEAPSLHAVGSSPVQIVRGAGEVGMNDVAHLHGLLFRLATRRLRVSTPYLVADEALGPLLCDAAQRGVEVDVLVPGPHIDKRVGQLAGEEEYGALIGSGVRIHAFQPSMLHAKVTTVDGEVAVVGTTNLNARSTTLDQEVDAVIVDRDVVEVLDRHFETDVDRSEPAEPAEGLQRLVAEATDLIDDAL